MSPRPILFAASIAGFLGVGVAVPDFARAQTRGGEDCVVPREAGGLIRGDRVPTGCVMIERPAREAPSRPAIVSGHIVVLVPVLVRSTLFLSDPPFVGVPLGPGAVTGADSLPRVRSGAFGPIERPFGPVTQPFRPTHGKIGSSPAQGAPAPAPAP
ncbi:MAG: hypothetical protein ACREKI_05010 [Gemmatimonadota bacterium]